MENDVDVEARCFSWRRRSDSSSSCRYGLVFTAPKGGPIRRPAFYRLVWKPATIATGLEGFRVGQLRHTDATLALEAGASPLLVAFRLGHTSTRIGGAALRGSPGRASTRRSLRAWRGTVRHVCGRVRHESHSEAGS